MQTKQAAMHVPSVRKTGFISTTVAAASENLLNAKLMVWPSCEHLDRTSVEG